MIQGKYRHRMGSLFISALLMFLPGCENSVRSNDNEQNGPDTRLNDGSPDVLSDGSTAPLDSNIPELDAGSVLNPDTSIPEMEMRSVFTHKMVKSTGDNPFSSLAYECPQCTFEQWNSIEPPEGWSKGPAQVALFSSTHSEMRSYPMAEGHPESVDFLEEVPGNEYRLIAITLNGTLVERGPSGIVAQVQVQRDTRLVFTAGTRIHELTDPEGNVFVLFVHHRDEAEWLDVDFQAEDVLSYFVAPTGWSYSTRIIDEELALDSDDSDGVVTVLAVRRAVNSTWQKR